MAITSTDLEKEEHRVIRASSALLVGPTVAYATWIVRSPADCWILLIVEAIMNNL